MANTLIQLKINNRPYGYYTALTIFQACLQKKIYLPRFCYHVALKIAGNCRMCLIEEKSSLKPVASCAVTIVAGMHVYTQTEMVKKAREGVIEYLLINHPLDCPICDQGGECDLQDQTMVFGADRGRFYEAKRTTSNKNLGFLIKTFLNRCIHCARCTRFLQEVAGSDKLSLLGRGYKTEISTYTEQFLTSEISGNIIDLCPVGALTSKPYAFKARPWELVSVYMYDIAEPFGANIELNYRGLELMRILPRINYEINGEWISDKTRFFYDAFMIQRLTSLYRVRLGSYRQSSWVRFFGYWKNATRRLTQSPRVRREDWMRQWYINGQAGEYADLETLTAFKNLFFYWTGKLFPSYQLNSCSDIYGYDAGKYLFCDGDHMPTLIILLNINLRLESPVLNIKIRKLIVEKFINTKLVGFYANLNYEIEHLAGGSMSLKELFKVVTEQSPLIICGSTTPVRHPLTIAAESVYKVWENFGAISAAEVLGGSATSSSDNWQRGVFRFLLGQPAWSLYRKRKSLGILISLLHHVEDLFWLRVGGRRPMPVFNAYKLPTKFYLEKISSYYSESGYFFSTVVNIAGYAIRGTREEWKILAALLEISGKNSETDFMKNFDQDFGRRISFNMLKRWTACREEKTSRPRSSAFNNYYEKDLLSRISPVLSLCARTYVKTNDYQLLTFE